MLVKITTGNIGSFRGCLTIQTNDMPDDIWSVFEKAVFDNSKNAQLIPVSQTVSTKNQLDDEAFKKGLKADPRQTAYDRMCEAAKGKLPRREPITVRLNADMTFDVVDGNATIQVLMFLGWQNVPAIVV